MTVCMSDETHWLRRACARNRQLILAEVSNALELNVQTTQDLNSHGREPLACLTMETLHHDIYQPHGVPVVRVGNYVCETSHAVNGILCSLAPWHGLIIFHGRDRSGSVSCGSLVCDIDVAYILVCYALRLI